MVWRWPASRGYFATTPSTSSRSVRPSRADHVRPGDPTISRYVAKSRTWTRIDRFHGPAVLRPLSSGRKGAGQDFPAAPAELRSESVQVRIERLLEFLSRGLGPKGAEIPKRLNPPTAPLLVVPEIQVPPPANLICCHATADLHRPESNQPNSRETMHLFVSGNRRNSDKR